MFIAGGKTLVMLMALIYSGRQFGTYITSDGQARHHSYACTHAQAFSLNAICFLSLLALQILGGLKHDTRPPCWETCADFLQKYISNHTVLLYFRSSYMTLPITKRQFKGKTKIKPNTAEIIFLKKKNWNISKIRYLLKINVIFSVTEIIKKKQWKMKKKNWNTFVSIR